MSITSPYLWYSTYQNLSSKVIFALGSKSRVCMSPLMMCLRLSKRQFANESNTTQSQRDPSAIKEELSEESETDKIMAVKDKVIQDTEAAVKDLKVGKFKATVNQLMTRTRARVSLKPENLLRKMKDRLFSQWRFGWKDKYMRALAENENLRNRSKKLVEDSKLYGIQSFSKDLLEVADILETATESVPEDEIKKNEHLKHLFEGVTMTQTQLRKVFGNHGLEKVDPSGEKFDPNFHEALFTLPSPDKKPGTVAVVTKVGYRLHGRPLRAALVGVVQ